MPGDWPVTVGAWPAEFDEIIKTVDGYDGWTDMHKEIMKSALVSIKALLAVSLLRSLRKEDLASRP